MKNNKDLPQQFDDPITRDQRVMEFIRMATKSYQDKLAEVLEQRYGNNKEEEK